MSAPERIWAFRYTGSQVEGKWDAFERTYSEAEYVRADIHEALATRLAEVERERDGAFTVIRGLHGAVATAETALSSALAENERLKAALERSKTALDDWVHQYASEFCRNEFVVESIDRIMRQGGTLAYIASVQAQNRTALNGGTPND